MKQEAIKLLEQITRGGSKREDRPVNLLRNPESDGTEGWFMHLPRCFNDALDIKQTSRQVDGKTVIVWTQGAGFAFKSGDIIYNSARGYDEWAQALPHIRLCVQIRSATDATSLRPSVDRSPGIVAFDVLVPSPDMTRLVHSASHAVTQDTFVRFLISGEGLPQ
jgi:hypothetical protein